MITPLESPNGVGLSPDGTRLDVAETFTACVWWWAVSGPGKLEPAAGLFPHGGTLLTRLPGFQFLDSLGVDGEGNVCLATLGSGGTDRWPHAEQNDPCSAAPQLRQSVTIGCRNLDASTDDKC